MPVGPQIQSTQVDNILSSLAVRLRDLASDILESSAYLNNLGLAGLETAGYSAADAQTALNDIDFMTTIAQVYKGTATQAAEFNFENALTSLWGGQ